MDCAAFAVAAASTIALLRARAAAPPPPDTRLRVGILGTAFIAGKNRRGIAASGAARVVAIASRDLPRATAWALEAAACGDIPGPPVTAHGSYEALIADPGVDAVYIPLPCGLHLPWVRAAAAAGKAVLCEKPAATSVSELEAMLAACAASNVAWLDGTMFHFHPRAAAMEAELRGLAPLARVVTAFSFAGDAAFFAGNIRTSPLLEPLGCLGDLGQYCIRFGLWAFGWELPATVRAVAHQVNGGGVPMDATATFVWPGGGPGGAPRTLLVDCSFTTAFRQWAEVAGGTGVLRLNDFVISRTHEETEFHTVLHPGLNGAHSRVVGVATRHGSGGNQEAAMWAAFAGAARGRGFVPAWAAHSLATQACLDAAMASMAAGGAEVAVVAPRGLAGLLRGERPGAAAGMGGGEQGK